MGRTVWVFGLAVMLVPACSDAKFGGSTQAPAQASRSANGSGTTQSSANRGNGNNNGYGNGNGNGNGGNQGQSQDAVANGAPGGDIKTDASVDGNASTLGTGAPTGGQGSGAAGAAGSDLGITTDGGQTTKPPDTVVGLTATVSYDGVVQFCVDFAAGKLIFATQQSRIDNPALRVDSQVQYMSGKVAPSTAMFNTPTPDQESPLPGNWSFVANANPVASNVIRLSGKGDAPVYHLSTTGTRACFDGDDSGHDQTGLVQLTLNYQLTPK